MKLFAAHVIDFVHSRIMQHWPWGTCLWVAEFWPEGDHTCWFCKWAWDYDD